MDIMEFDAAIRQAASNASVIPTVAVRCTDCRTEVYEAANNRLRAIEILVEAKRWGFSPIQKEGEPKHALLCPSCYAARRLAPANQ